MHNDFTSASLSCCDIPNVVCTDCKVACTLSQFRDSESAQKILNSSTMKKLLHNSV